MKVIKLGGSLLDDACRRDAVLREVAREWHAGEQLVIVLDRAVNPLIVNELVALGVKAEGISGSSILIAEKHPPIDGIDLLNVGRVIGAKPVVVTDTLPVISCVAGAFNVNADSAAAAVAVALRADSLEFVTDVAGLLDENGAVVSSLHANAVETWIENVSGGMKPKLQAALHALRSGVKSIAIGENGGTNLVAA